MFSTLGLSQPRINLQGIFVSNGYKELNFWFGFCTPLWKGETTNDEWERGRILTGTKNCTNSCKVIKVKTFCMTFLIHQNKIVIFVQFWRICRIFLQYLSTGKYLNISTFGSHSSKPVFLQIRNCCLLLSSKDVVKWFVN